MIQERGFCEIREQNTKHIYIDFTRITAIKGWEKNQMEKLHKLAILDFGFAPLPLKNPLLMFLKAGVLKHTLENTELLYKRPSESSCMLIKRKMRNR